MTTFEHLRQIHDECVKRQNCDDCPNKTETPIGMDCVYKWGLGQYPYLWYVELLEGTLKEY